MDKLAYKSWLHFKTLLYKWIVLSLFTYFNRCFWIVLAVISWNFGRCIPFQKDVVRCFYRGERERRRCERSVLGGEWQICFHIVLPFKVVLAFTCGFLKN